MKKTRIGFVSVAPRALFGLALVAFSLASAVLVTGCGNMGAARPPAPGSRSSAPTMPAEALRNVTIEIHGETAPSYGENPLVIPPGTSVTWVNSDSRSHSATANNGSFDSGALAPEGGTYSYTFTKPGTYAYHSSVSEDRMSGTIRVAAPDPDPEPTTIVNPDDPNPIPTYPVDCKQCQQQQKPVPKPIPKPIPKPQPKPAPKPTKPMPKPTLY